MSLYSKKNYKQTVKACGEILTAQPDNFEAMNLMGDAYCQMGDKEKCLEVYDALLRKFEGGNYLEKSIALVKKIIRNYPDKESYQEKLADLYGQKALITEQISILTGLLEDKSRRGFVQETDRILRRLTSVKSANSSDIASLIEVMRRFGSSNEVRLMAEKGLALKSIAPADLTLFINCAVETGADSELYIKHLPDYIRNNPDSTASLTDVIAEHLEKNFDKAYFAEIVKSAELPSLVPLFVRLKRKYPKPEIYAYLLENAVAERHADSFEHILAEKPVIFEGSLRNRLTVQFNGICLCNLNAKLRNTCAVYAHTPFFYQPVRLTAGDTAVSGKKFIKSYCHPPPCLSSCHSRKVGISERSFIPKYSRKCFVVT